MPIFILVQSLLSVDPEQLPLFYVLDILIKESVGKLWLSLRPVCELQGKVTESELPHKGKSYR